MTRNIFDFLELMNMSGSQYLRIKSILKLKLNISECYKPEVNKRRFLIITFQHR